ncbi:hypothetical protein RI543_001772 [Arxiozyma heterogenica]|uniref:RRM domain-containing protein n=1 Tax=Arxiozyma heterogenica TaxID=278026 RepID=A0AAN7WIE4_9SACH|nr:hypothetical protein RI543_001772 [Kazachstania heterogenica]
MTDTDKKETTTVNEIAKALSDPTKKRKAEDEIEIDLQSSIPLSKKQKRLLRRGKITLEELNAKYKADTLPTEHKSTNGNDSGEVRGDGNTEGSSDVKLKKEKIKTYGVWIGNLSFDTTQDEIIRFLVGKTSELEAEESRISEKDIVRIKLPLTKNDGKQIKNKGFCYIDFKNEKQMQSCIALSESQLNGRNLLIKNSENYEGRPDKNDLISSSKNPPSRILFVGNLSYSTTEDLLRSHFQHCGDIVRVRMATFEDSGKCKGFAFIDFKNVEGATKALTDKSCRKIAMRPIRMEYGEDRSKRQVRKSDKSVKSTTQDSFDLSSSNDYLKKKDDNQKGLQEKISYKKPKNNNFSYTSNNRIKSSIALASAQRGSAAIVPHQGKKIKFD